MTACFTSLFSGCGGFDLGFIHAGFSCRAAFDFDKDAIAAYRRNIGTHTVTAQDVVVPYGAASLKVATIERIDVMAKPQLAGRKITVLETDVARFEI